MTIYKSKPVIIEAMQFTEENKQEVYNWCREHQYNIQPSQKDGKPVLLVPFIKDPFIIPNEVGEFVCEIGDFVVKDNNPLGWQKFSVVKGDNFNLVFEINETESNLTFNSLRRANTERLPLFKNSKGEPAHEKQDGSDWSLGEWMNAVSGELGEAANIIKKVRRGDLTIEEARESLGKEFADIVTYLDIAAFRAGIDLGKATVNKFNEVSRRVGCEVYL